MTKNNDKKELPIVSMTEAEREGVWDELFVKEEGLVLEFDPNSNTGKVKSLDDNSVYDIDRWVPNRVEPQEHNRFRFWGVIDELESHVLRVVTLEDKNTIHNAFPDRRFKP